MVETPGFCSRKTTCSIAASGRPVVVSLENPFICPECGYPLTSPPLAVLNAKARKKTLIPVALALGLAVLCMGFFASGAFLVRRQPPPPPAPTVVTLARTILLGPSVTQVPDTTAVTIASLPPETIPADEPAPGEAVFLPRPVAGGAPAYPEALADDGRRGRVIVTCTIEADGRPTGCRATANQGGPIFATAALTWLRHGGVQYRPVMLDGTAQRSTQSWLITMTEPKSMLARAKRQKHIVEERTGNAHGDVRASFSTPLIDGGLPDYPDQYQDGQSGDVTVTCTIQTDGKTAGCTTLKATGGRIFDVSVHAWLDLKPVRFRPFKIPGRVKPHPVLFTVHFIGQAPEPE
jgi:TonB family protein